MTPKLAQFENEVNQMWKAGMANDLVKQLPLLPAFKDQRILAIYLTQVYHYAVHTPRHQALVGVNPNNQNFKYMQYCFEHAYEETGHELMALNDIAALGYDINEDNMPPRLPATDKLITFLYKEANSDTPIHHLGYGFWSENACPFIGDFMKALMDSMGIDKRQMTFYSNHVTIDEGHAQEVRKIVASVAQSEDDWQGMHRVAKVTFDLTLGIVLESFQAYQELISGKSDAFAIFK